MNKPIVAAIAALLSIQAAHAEVVNFNEVSSSFQGVPGFTSGSLTFTHDSGASVLGVWTDAPTSGAYNGTPYLLDGFGDVFTITATDHGAFALNSFSAALGWYTTLAAADVTVTYALAGGGTNVVDYALSGSYAKFSPGLRVTSATFDLANLTDGYISLDNIAVSSVPEPGGMILMLCGLVFTAEAAKRRQARRR